MAPPGCLPRCHLRGSVRRRGRARHPLPPPRQSFSGPGVSLSSPALRPRGPPRLGPPRRDGGTRPGHREPRTPRNREAAAAAAARGWPPSPQRRPAAAHTHVRPRPEARPGTSGGARPVRVPLPREGAVRPGAGFLPGGTEPRLPGAGRAGGAASSEPRRPSRATLCPSPCAIGRRCATAGRPAAAWRAKERGMGGGCASGRGRAGHPSLPHAGGSLARQKGRAGLGRTRAAGARAGASTGSEHRRPAFGGAGRGGGEARGPVASPRSPAGTDRQRTGAGRGVGKTPPRRLRRHALRGPAATSGVARGEPRPQAR